MKKYFFFFLIITACKFDTDQNQPDSTIDLGPSGPNKSYGYINNITKFDQLFELKDTVYLDTDSNALLNRPWKVKIRDDKFFILDKMGSNVIQVFTNSGNYLGKVGSIGAGPGEYKSAELMEIINDELFVYDIELNRVTVFDTKSNRFLRSWKTEKYYSSLVAIKGKLVFLNLYGQGYENDFDVLDKNGILISTGKFAKSLGESKRRYMFGGSFQLSVQSDHLLYIGADEFKILCYDIHEKKHLWISQMVPTKLKVPSELPTNIQKLGIKWMILNYSALKSLLTLNNGLILLFADDYIVIYDDGGNYLKMIKNPYPTAFFTTNSSRLLLFRDGVMDKNGNLSNPMVLVYECVKSS
jgi:hypothetical protein